MSFVQRELNRIESALRECEPHADGLYDRLYAAQRALSWALEPTGSKAPYSAIMGTPEGSKDCPSSSRPVES